MSILVVDDEPSILTMTRKLLESKGYHVAVSPSARDAQVMMGEVSFQLVMTDIVMPDIDGLELIKWIREHHPQTKILAFSGNSLLDPGNYLHIAGVMGAVRTLRKPFETAALLSAVKALVGDPPGNQ
ncbi:MAG: response regulator [Acidobacteriota bacterium]|nr:response regulator [Acidobacteriota bacterium]